MTERKSARRAPAAATEQAGAGPDIEGLGVFYLGRSLDTETGRPGPPLLVDARRFTTHAVCVGMTGSGKTGLLIGLVEEAAIDGIPTLIIDPKGDLANILLTFPDLAPDSFRPWLEEDAARRDGITMDELAARTARRWREGLESSGQSAERIGRLRAAVDMAVYTPGSRSGRPLAMLQSLDPPEGDDDPESRRDRIDSLVAGILALAGIDGEPGRSREHVLLASIVDALWRSGQRIDFATLVRAIPAPPLERVGFLDLENFYPAGDRFQLASRLNTVAAAPGFEAWLQGEPLDIDRLLWTAAGRPRVSVISIAHLSDAQRMAFVTLLTGQIVSWMRGQGGTSSLKALFLMDEVFGYMPPTANPPSKGPLLTLLKQARAFGLGVVLATQNPVDLDYKGLSNAGTWFLGRLQTARDKARVLDGLEGAASSAGRGFDRGRLDRLLSGLEQRMFLMHSVHEEAETVFQTRWTLSYLRGPLLREEIRRLTAAGPDSAPPSVGRQPVERPLVEPVEVEMDRSGGLALGAGRPLLPPGVREVFLAPRAGAPVAPDGLLRYHPAILGRARVRYAKASARMEVDREVICIAPASDQLGESAWDQGEVLPEAPEVEMAPRPATFAPLPASLAGPRGYATLATSLKAHLGRTSRLTVWRAPALDAVSRPGETEAEFRVRIAQQAREWRDGELDRVRTRYATRLSSLDDKIARARQKVEREKAEAKNQSMQTYVSIGTAVLSAILGRKVASSTNVGRAATSMRSASRAARQQADVAQAEESLGSLEEKRQALADEIDVALAEVRGEASPERMRLEPIEIPARKTDIAVDEVVLAWVPAVVTPPRQRFGNAW
jgi:hypothetical protein